MASRWVVVLVALGGTMACGPSFQAVYENDARFEHCYALEETEAASLQQKSDCWGDWTRNHTYGQTRDRVEYARNRHEALLAVPAQPTDEAMMMGAPGEVKAGDTAAAPTPTNAFAPPPKMDSRDGGGPVSTWILDAAVAPAPTQRPPGADCIDECTASWNTCRQSCGIKCDGCDKTSKTCVAECMKK
jgi:hypothetical protein